jgi:hypothetical protein
MPSAHEITELLQAWSGGDPQALDRLTPLVYNELHRSAQRYMARERPDHTLKATALIDEVYLRLVDSGRVTWQDRNHFFAVCARLMRRILTDFARSRHYKKRGAGAQLTNCRESLDWNKKSLPVWVEWKAHGIPSAEAETSASYFRWVSSRGIRGPTWHLWRRLRRCSGKNRAVPPWDQWPS